MGMWSWAGIVPVVRFAIWRSSTICNQSLYSLHINTKKKIKIFPPFLFTDQIFHGIIIRIVYNQN